ncbi:MAG: tyrosine-type recombinase/integrase [Pirellulales bacterium]
MAAWGANNGNLPEGFRLELKAAETIPQPINEPTGVLTVADLLAFTIAEVGAGKTKKQLRNNSRWFRLRKVAAVLEPYAAMPAVEFGPRLLGQVAKTMAQTPMQRTRHGEHVPPTETYIREIVTAIKRIFEEAIAREDLPADRLVALNSLTKLPLEGARQSEPVQPVEQDIVEATCAVLPPVAGDLFRFIMFTGCRPSEATAITPAMVDMSQEPWVWQPKNHKTKHKGKGRTIGIGPQARQILKRWISGKGANDLIFTRSQINRAVTENMISFAMCKSDREQFDKNDLAKMLHRAIKAAGVPHWTPYQLRHRGLTVIRQEGGRDAAQAQAGHSNGDMTERYARPTLGDAAEIIERVG